MGWVLYDVFHVIVYVLARILFRLKVVGDENIPAEGGVIVASNHVSYLDPPLLGCAIKRRVNFMAREELFRMPLLGCLIKKFNAFPVKRDKADRTAIKKAISLLKNGEVVAMFPEGARSEDGLLQKPKPGIGLITTLSGVSVVPTYIKGTEVSMPVGVWNIRFSPVTIYFGEPLNFPLREDYQSIGQKIMDRIAEIKDTVNR
ncbi:MAG: lysophospholipid acyltransferase family protein [Nitrospirota bacterium]